MDEFALVPEPHSEVTRVLETLIRIDELRSWLGKVETIRTYAIPKNQHQLTAMNMRTLDRLKNRMTVHFGQDYDEINDLVKDSEEFVKLWDRRETAELKTR